MISRPWAPVLLLMVLCAGCRSYGPASPALEILGDDEVGAVRMVLDDGSTTMLHRASTADGQIIGYPCGECRASPMTYRPESIEWVQESRTDVVMSALYGIVATVVTLGPFIAYMRGIRE